MSIDPSYQIGWVTKGYFINISTSAFLDWITLFELVKYIK